MSMTRPPTLRTPADGRTIAVVGDLYRFLATGEDTNGKYAMWEAIVPPDGGPPPHVHSREDEGFYILEGEITLQVGEKRIVATAGMFANMPVGTPHSFKNETARPARMLIFPSHLPGWNKCSSRLACQLPREPRLSHRPRKKRSRSC
jgi:uncharacterized cupin superfamily protein